MQPTLHYSWNVKNLGGLTQEGFPVAHSTCPAQTGSDVGYGRFTDQRMVYLVMLPFQGWGGGGEASRPPMSGRGKAQRLSPNLNCFAGKWHVIIPTHISLARLSHMLPPSCKGERECSGLCAQKGEGIWTWVTAGIPTIKNQGLIVQRMESGRENFKHSTRTGLSDPVLFSSKSHGLHDFVSLADLTTPDT